LLRFIAIGGLPWLICATVDDTNRNPTDVIVLGSITTGGVLRRSAAF